MPETLRIARKEFRAFFASPAGYLFLGAFLAATLFVFFWVEAFFARNIADVRPLFQWMPVLLMFLIAALTMRAWSEERRAGTIEMLLTAPVRPRDLVLGKFLAALVLVAVALAMTLPLPITVSFLGPLDWGPVIGGYVAALFLAAAYVAIGLYTSGRTDNPIVALILTTVVCGLFYLVGSDLITPLFGHEVARVLALLGSGARFDSITRGVLDLRDVYYYVSIVGMFLTLNLFTLERLRWAGNPACRRHRLWGWTTALACANFLAANLWLSPVAWARVDLTEGRLHSLSEATKHQLAGIDEPLLIRGYFSSKTHPLLAPLVPRIRDLLQEYAVAGGERVRVEFVDPHTDRDAEEEAASKYDVRPVPFQTASRYQAAVVSSYFDIVVAYGDQHEKLGFRDLIEVKSRGEADVDVVLKNPEYAVTAAIRKVVQAYEAGGDLFARLDKPVAFKAYVSPDEQLPEALRTLRADLAAVLDDMKKKAGGKLEIAFTDPEANGGLVAKELRQRYGFAPQIASLADPRPFWFYMVIEGDGQSMQVPLPGTLDKAGLKASIEPALQRLAPGLLRTVAVVKPQASPFGGQQYNMLTEALGGGVRLKDTDLKNGRVPEDADLLLVLAPRELDDKQRFAIDQFLMRGGSVVLATSPFDVQVGQNLVATKQTSGLEDWLAHHGLTVEKTMVLDSTNVPLAVPVQRYLGGLPVREIRMLPYPHFPDLRGDGLDRNNPVTASLGQLTVPWASPITVDAGKNAGRKVAELLNSSPGSWTSDALEVLPDYRAHPETGFAVSGERGRRVLGVAVEGRFESFFKDKPSPLGEGGNPTVLQRSPDSARLILVASNAMASDSALNLVSQAIGALDLKPVEFVLNAIDWSLEDSDLLALRGRTQFARTLVAMAEEQQRLWEGLNYGLALAALGLVWMLRRWAGRNDRVRYRRILAEV